MPIRLDRWIRSNEAASTARTPSSAVPLAAQSRDDPDPYSFPAMTSSGTPSAAYRCAASKIVICSPLGQVAGVAALGAGDELVAQPDVGECAADHHLVVAAPGPVGVELPRLHPVRRQILPGRGVGLDRPGRGDVVGGDRVAEQGQHPCVFDAGQRSGLRGQIVEERRAAHVGGGRVPGECVPGRDRQGPPAVVAGEHLRVLAGEHLRAQAGGDDLADLGRRRPDVAQVHRLAVAAGAQRVGGQVDVHRPGQRVGDHQRRGGQVVQLGLGVDAALEVPVAGQHRADRKVPLGDRGARPRGSAARSCRCRWCSRSRPG